MLQKRIRKLLTLLDNTDDVRKQLPILDELSRHLSVINPAEAEKYARRLLKIAVLIEDRPWLVKGYVKLGQSLGMQANYRGEKRYLQKALTLLQQLPDDPCMMAIVSCNLGRSYFQLGNTRAALPLIEQSLQFAKRSGDLFAIGTAYACAGNIYRNLGRYTIALEMMDEALKVYEVLSYTQGIASIEWARGHISAVVENWEQAILHYRKSLALNRRIGNRQQEAIIYKSLGAAYAVKMEYRKALRLHHKAHKLFEELNDEFQSAQALVQIGYVYLFQNRYDSAMVNFQLASRTFETLKIASGRALALLAIADVLVERHQWQEVIPVALKGLRIGRHTDQILHQRHAHQLLAGAYEQTGSFSKALRHYKRSLELEQVWTGKDVWEKLRAVEISDSTEGITREHETAHVLTKQLEQEVEHRSIELKAVSIQVQRNTETLREFRDRLVALKASHAQSEKVIDPLIGEIDESLHRTVVWKTFETQIQKHDYAFSQKLAAMHSSLTPSELRICSLLRVNLSNEEIAAILNLSKRTIETHRTRIRKKLGLERAQDLLDVLSRVK